MTIKQHGGVFGRNPKFNSIEAESLSIAGNAVPDASTILVDGDIGSTVQGYDADTAKLDAAQTFTAAQTFNENIVMANGKGIDFSATGDGSGTTSSELFDDYEEGTWTPALRALTTDFSSVTYHGGNVGTYVKIGNTVFVQGTMRTSAVTIGSASGSVYIDGLPFTQPAVNNAFTMGYMSGFTGSYLPTNVNAFGNRIYIYSRTSFGGSNFALTPSYINTGLNLITFAGAYSV